MEAGNAVTAAGNRMETAAGQMWNILQAMLIVRTVV